jgi:hypothetical protein
VQYSEVHEDSWHKTGQYGRQPVGTFCHAQKNRLPVDGQMVKVKADEIALKTGINFEHSNRWLQHLKERHNITWHSVREEGAAADLGSAQN